MIPYKGTLWKYLMIPNKGILKYKYLSENAEEGMDGLGQAFKMNKVLPKVDMATAL